MVRPDRRRPRGYPPPARRPRPSPRESPSAPFITQPAAAQVRPPRDVVCRTRRSRAAGQRCQKVGTIGQVDAQGIGIRAPLAPSPRPRSPCPARFLDIVGRAETCRRHQGGAVGESGSPGPHGPAPSSAKYGAYNSRRGTPGCDGMPSCRFWFLIDEKEEVRCVSSCSWISSGGARVRPRRGPAAGLVRPRSSTHGSLVGPLATSHGTAGSSGLSR